VTPVRPSPPPTPPEKHVVEALKRLFVARGDTFALQTPNGYVRQDRPLTDEDLLAHIRGEQVVGVYQLAPDGTVKWACLDFDAHDGSSSAAESAKSAFLALRERHGRACLLEHSGGGFHVWLFFARPIPARAARELVRGVGDGAEVFPKQERVEPGGFGSLVKLPLGRNLKWGNWSVLLDPPSLLDVEPAEVDPSPAGRREEEGEEPLPPAFGGCVAVARIGQGVDEGCRDEAAFFLARVMCCTGLTAEMALAALLAWNRKNRPPLPEKTVAEKVRNAYSRRYGVSGWSIRKNGVLSPFCSQCATRVCERGKRRAPPPRMNILDLG